jgi:hypothetical protein
MIIRFHLFLPIIILVISTTGRSSAIAPTPTQTLEQYNLDFTIPGTYPGKCSPLKQVNDNAFGLPSDFNKGSNSLDKPAELPFLSEEAFEIIVFRISST